MVLTSQFASREAMNHAVDMGVEDGLRATMRQIDGVLGAA